MKYRIGSFNLYNFNCRHDSEIAKNVNEIASIIVSEGFDVVALQEIRGDITMSPIFKSLMQALGKDWEADGASVDNAVHHDYAEAFAFIWNKRRLRKVNETTTIFNDRGMASKLVRPPLFIRLSPNMLPGGSFFEFRLINVHLAFTKPFDSNAVSDVDYRRKEFDILANEVYPRISTKRFGNNMPAYTIMLGDYNLCIAGTNKIVARGSDVLNGFVDVNTRDGMVLRTMQSEKSTLKKEKQINSMLEKDTDKEAESTEVIENRFESYYSQDYDHFTLDTGLLDKLGISVSRIEAVEKYYAGNLSNYRREVSDHVPIKLEIDFGG